MPEDANTINAHNEPHLMKDAHDCFRRGSRRETCDACKGEVGWERDLEDAAEFVEGD
jgi:hypothetical protein